MNRVIERLCHCDAERASHVLRIVKVWVAYVGILCLGGMIFGAPLYVWFDRSLVAADIAHQAEIGRMQEINADLMVTIRDRLPPIAKQKSDTDKSKTSGQEEKSPDFQAEDKTDRPLEWAAHSPAAKSPDWLNSP